MTLDFNKMIYLQFKCEECVCRFFSGEIGKKPNTAAQMVFKGVKKASDTVCVVTVIIPDEHVFQPFSNRIAELTLKQMQVPADIDKSPVAGICHILDDFCFESFLKIWLNILWLVRKGFY